MLSDSNEKLQIDLVMAEMRVTRLEEQVASLRMDNECASEKYEEELQNLRENTPAVNLAVIRKRHEDEMRNLKRKLVSAEEEIVRLRRDKK